MTKAAGAFIFGVIGALSYILMSAFSGCATTETQVIDKFHHCGGPGEVRCRLRAFQAQPWECCR